MTIRQVNPGFENNPDLLTYNDGQQAINDSIAGDVVQFVGGQWWNAYYDLKHQVQIVCQGTRFMYDQRIGRAVFMDSSNGESNPVEAVICGNAIFEFGADTGAVPEVVEWKDQDNEEYNTSNMVLDLLCGSNVYLEFQSVYSESTDSDNVLFHAVNEADVIIRGQVAISDNGQICKADNCTAVDVEIFEQRQSNRLEAYRIDNATEDFRFVLRNSQINVGGSRTDELAVISLKPYNADVEVQLINNRFIVPNGSNVAIFSQVGATMEVDTIAVVSFDYDSAIVSGEVLSGESGDERGICYAVTENPTIEDDFVQSGTGVGLYESELTGLVAETLYYVRAYQKRGIEVVYGDQLSFTTEEIPLTEMEVDTIAVVSFDYDSAIVSGEVLSGESGDERGICYAVTENPTIEDDFVQSGTGVGLYESELTGLVAETLYYVRAYQKRGIEVVYGDQLSFTTEEIPLTAMEVATRHIESYAGTSAVFNAEVIGGESGDERGICYAVTENPTIEDDFVQSGTGIGEYQATLSGLTAGTRYFVRAYQKRGVDVQYGEQASFITAYERPAQVSLVSGLTTYDFDWADITAIGVGDTELLVKTTGGDTNISFASDLLMTEQIQEVLKSGHWRLATLGNAMGGGKSIWYLNMENVVSYDVEEATIEVTLPKDASMTFIGNINYFCIEPADLQIKAYRKNDIGTSTYTYADMRALLYEYLGIQDKEYFWKFANMMDNKTTTIYLPNMASVGRVGSVVTITFTDASTWQYTYPNADFAQNELEYLEEMHRNMRVIINPADVYATITDVSPGISAATLNSTIAAASSGTAIRMLAGSYTFDARVDLKPGVDIIQEDGVGVVSTPGGSTFCWYLNAEGKSRIYGLGAIEGVGSFGILGVHNEANLNKCEVIFCAKTFTQSGGEWVFHAGADRGAFRVKARSGAETGGGVWIDSDDLIDYKDVDIRHVECGLLFHPNTYNIALDKDMLVTWRMGYADHEGAYASHVTQLIQYHFAGLYKSSTFWGEAAGDGANVLRIVNFISDNHVAVGDDVWFEVGVFILWHLTVDGNCHIKNVLDADMTSTINGTLTTNSAIASLSYANVTSTLFDDVADTELLAIDVSASHIPVAQHINYLDFLWKATHLEDHLESKTILIVNRMRITDADNHIYNTYAEARADATAGQVIYFENCDAVFHDITLAIKDQVDIVMDNTFLDAEKSSAWVGNSEDEKLINNVHNKLSGNSVCNIFGTGYVQSKIQTQSEVSFGLVSLWGNESVLNLQLYQFEDPSERVSANAANLTTHHFGGDLRFKMYKWTTEQGRLYDADVLTDSGAVVDADIVFVHREVVGVMNRGWNPNPTHFIYRNMYVSMGIWSANNDGNNALDEGGTNTFEFIGVKFNVPDVSIFDAVASSNNVYTYSSWFVCGRLEAVGDLVFNNFGQNYTSDEGFANTQVGTAFVEDEDLNISTFAA